MATYIALLRAVNLPSHNKVSMADLRALVERLGMQNVRTVVQSGNLAFETGVMAPAKLEALLQAGATKHLGLATEFHVRSAKEWKAIIAANPFPAEAKGDPARLVLMPLRKAPDKASVTALQAAIKGREVVRANGREAYFVYPDGMGNSKLTTKLIERTLGTTGTARNWNTVLKLGGFC